MNLRKLFVLFALAPLFATQQAVGSKFVHLDRIGPQTATSEWQRYKVEGEEFSVLLPVVPAMTTRHISYARDKTRRERALAAYEDGVVYTVDTYEKKGISFDELIHRVAQGQKTEAVVADGVRGKSFYAEDERSVSTRRFFETSNTLYQFVAVASKLGDHSAGVSKFFSSITFGKSRAGRSVFDGSGEQPLTHANGVEPDSVFRNSQVTMRWRVVSKPEPPYTERGRKYQVTGTVVVRGIFSSSGAVENITVLRGLPEGLTESAVESARRIRFIPAIKDGRFVSTWMQLEYNFNLY
jgi:TonB family protein